MATAPYLVSYEVTQPTRDVPTGKLRLVADLGDSVGPLTIEIPGLTNGIEAMDAPAPDAYEYAYERAGIPPGASYVATIHDASPAHLADFSQGFTVDPAPVPVYGCTDPLADNYDPNATDDNGSCAYSPHLALVGALPELAPLGVPLLARLAATPPVGVGAGQPARCLLDLSGLGTLAGVQVRVDGYLFTSGPLIVPGRFQDAASLLAALLALPPLAAAYQLTSPAAGQVLITGRVPGLPGTPTVTSSNIQAVVVSLTAGVAALWSQRRLGWGCYLEIWVGCGTVYGGPVDKSTAVLAQRLPLPYRADNAYTFDLAPALRAFTGHAYPQAGGSCPDRLVSYFVRFGEEYALVAGGPRLARTTYESPVAWGLEALELPPLVGGLRLLTARPWPWRVPVGVVVPAAVLATPNADARLLLRYRLPTSRDVLSSPLPVPVALGVVALGAAALAADAAALSGQLLVCDTGGTVGPVLAELAFQAGGQGLTFVNRQGGCDTVYLLGNGEDSGKRTAATFSNQAGSQGLSADYQPALRLYSGLLDSATWEWLRRELAVSPQAWLLTGAGPVPYLIADLATEADRQKGEYSLSVDLQPALVRGLTN